MADKAIKISTEVMQAALDQVSDNDLAAEVTRRTERTAIAKQRADLNDWLDSMDTITGVDYIDINPRDASAGFVPGMGIQLRGVVMNEALLALRTVAWAGEKR